LPPVRLGQPERVSFDYVDDRPAKLYFSSLRPLAFLFDCGLAQGKPAERPPI
jgi:hypothetical protein